jgi:cytochrome c
MNHSRTVTKLVPVLGLAAILLGVVVVAASGQEEKDPAAEALAAAVEQGRTIFRNEEFGTNGKACATCHENPDRPKLHLKDRVGDYPKYDKRERKVITLGQKINQMIERMVRGEPLELGSEKLVAIEAWLMEKARSE